MSQKRFFVYTFLGLLILTGYVYVINLDWLRANFSQQHRLTGQDLSGVYDHGDLKGSWEGKTVYSSEYLGTTQLAQKDVLGLTTSNKRIEVDLTNQRLYAFEGENKVYDFPISSGLYDWTPRGTFETWIKLKYAKMSGGNQALGTYYYLPNVPYIMYFYNESTPKWKGFGIHGAYWHNDFGRPKSHGCINLLPEDAEKLFYWTPPDTGGKNSIYISDSNPGIKIVIYGKYKG